MKTIVSIISIVFAVSSGVAMAGWTALPTSSSTTSPCGSVSVPSIRCTGIANPTIDTSSRIRIAPGSVSSTSGGITYYNLPSTLSLVASSSTAFSSGSGSTLYSGTFYDYVFLDSTTSTLVFGARLNMSGSAEANDIFRTGFTGYTKTIAWTPLSSADLRLYSAAATNSGFGTTDSYNADYVDFRSDINAAEGNPWSGLYLVRTDATTYHITENAIEIRQGGEEGQPVLSEYLSGYAPGSGSSLRSSAVSLAAVPEPSSYALFLFGFSIIGVLARRNT